MSRTLTDYEEILRYCGDGTPLRGLRISGFINYRGIVEITLVNTPPPHNDSTLFWRFTFKDITDFRMVVPGCTGNHVRGIDRGATEKGIRFLLDDYGFIIVTAEETELALPDPACIGQYPVTPRRKNRRTRLRVCGKDLKPKTGGCPPGKV